MAENAAMIEDATHVPWPPGSSNGESSHDPSFSALHEPSIDGMSVVKLRLSERLKLGAMSGCVPSMPGSMMPTRTP